MIFLNFFYLLKNYGLPVSIHEWLDLINALNQGLAHSSLVEFYYLSRTILIKSEADFDQYDLAFSHYFEGVAGSTQIPDELMEYLSHPISQQEYDKDEVDRRTRLKYDQLRELLEQRLREQVGVHNGGKRWIGTGGTSPFGNSGYSYEGLRVGGGENRHTAMQLASKREYQDFRTDQTVGLRQFQMAFRRLRQMSAGQSREKTELDIDATISETSENGGYLKLSFSPPRKNAIKLLLLFDSGGSMTPYAQMCNQLFQAVSKANHFKELKIYYFHNCPYNRIYKTPECIYRQSFDTQWLLNTYSSDYRMILVGDASMAMWEMRYYTGGREGHPGDRISGLEWLSRMTKKYKHSVWLNPIPSDLWSSTQGRDSIQRIRSEIEMYPLSIDGIEAGIRKLMVQC